LGWGEVSRSWVAAGGERAVGIVCLQERGDFCDALANVGSLVVGWWLSFWLGVTLRRWWQCVGDRAVISPPCSEMSDDLGVSGEEFALGCDVVEGGLAESCWVEVIDEHGDVSGEFHLGIFGCDVSSSG
jgi:hypothetical protein